MRRFVCVCLAVLFVLIQSQSFAQMAGPEAKEKGCDKSMMDSSMMMKAGAKEECPCCMMCGSMMQKKIIATSDGGVVVMTGNKLIKYDKNLKLVNEAQITSDQRMMGGCLMHKKFHSRDMSDDADPHAVDPYHHKPKTEKPEEGDQDLHSVDPYHHKPGI